MRWQKRSAFIALEVADSADLGKEVLVVASDAWESLPFQFEEQVPTSDADAFSVLRTAVTAGAQQNGFLPTEA